MRSQPSALKRGRIGRRILEIAARDVVAADVDVADVLRRQLAVLVIGDAHPAVGDGRALGDQHHRILVAAGTGATGVPAFIRWRSSASVRSGAPTAGKLTASEASASPYTGYMAVRLSPDGARRARNSSHSSTEIGSAPLKIRRTADRSRFSGVRSPSTFR